MPRSPHSLSPAFSHSLKQYLTQHLAGRTPSAAGVIADAPKRVVFTFANVAFWLAGSNGRATPTRPPP